MGTLFQVSYSHVTISRCWSPSSGIVCHCGSTRPLCKTSAPVVGSPFVPVAAECAFPLKGASWRSPTSSDLLVTFYCAPAFQSIRIF